MFFCFNVSNETENAKNDLAWKLCRQLVVNFNNIFKIFFIIPKCFRRFFFAYYSMCLYLVENNSGKQM